MATHWKFPNHCQHTVWRQNFGYSLGPCSSDLWKIRTLWQYAVWYNCKMNVSRGLSLGEEVEKARPEYFAQGARFTIAILCRGENLTSNTNNRFRSGKKISVISQKLDYLIPSCKRFAELTRVDLLGKWSVSCFFLVYLFNNEFWGELWNRLAGSKVYIPSAKRSIIVSKKFQVSTITRCVGDLL